MRANMKPLILKNPSLSVSTSGYGSNRFGATSPLLSPVATRESKRDEFRNSKTKSLMLDVP